MQVVLFSQTWALNNATVLCSAVLCGRAKLHLTMTLYDVEEAFDVPV